MFCLNNFPVWFVCLGSECIILMRLPGESGFFMDSISYYFFLELFLLSTFGIYFVHTYIFHFSCSPFSFPLIWSYFQKYFPFRALCGWNLFHLPQVFPLLGNTWPLGSAPCTPAPWVIPIAIVAAPRMSPKKMRCISTAGCHIANGIEQCNTDIGGNNNSGETQWNVCNAWDEMQHALRPKK